MLRDLFVEVVEQCGYAVSAFADPMHYLEHMESSCYQTPVAVFTDIQMPGMNGYELIGQIHQRKREQMFVVMTGYEEVKSEFKKQACMFLKKPFRPETLQQVLKALHLCAEQGPDHFDCQRVVSEKLDRPEGWCCPHRHHT